MSAIAANYRQFILPWTPTEADERRFRRVAGIVFGLFAILCVVIPLLPKPPRTVVVLPVPPDRIVEFILKQPPKPEVKPPPPKPVPVKEAAAVRKPVTDVSTQQKPDPRAKAASSGLLALSKELAELRDMDQDRNPNATPLNAGVGDKSRVDRYILTAQTGSNSGGIAVARASAGFGGGSAGLKGNSTATVGSTVATAAAGGPEATRSGQSGKAARTREEVELVFDRNKAAIYALYSRALRDNPALKGKVVLELTIAPSGDVTACRIVSSELGDADLERKLVARVKMFKFEAKDVAVMTTTKPIEFFPA